MAESAYHYTESGLDNVYLASGFSIVAAPGGRRQVAIKDLEGLHTAIGRILIEGKKHLTGKEVRYLRNEMLLSQMALAKLLEVNVQAVHRWERGKSGVPKPADALIRLLYRQHVQGDRPANIRKMLEAFADLEDSVDGRRVTLRKSAKEWKLAQAA
jgi:putative transcriptional regulator